MAGKTINQFEDAGTVQVGDYIPIARGMTTLKLSGMQFVTKDANGNALFGPSIQTGYNSGSQDNFIELGSLRTANGNAYIDLHATPGTDYDARLGRWSGINGGFSVANTGTGNFDLWQYGAGTINLGTSNMTRMTINPTGSIGIGTSSPQKGLHIYGDEGNGSDLMIQAVQAPGYTGAFGPSLIFSHKGNASYAKTNDELALISSIGYSTATSSFQTAGLIKVLATGNFNSTATTNADIVIGTINANTYSDKMCIKASGRIGIGSSDPQATVDIQPGWLRLGRTSTSAEGGQIDFCRAGDNAAVWSIDQLGSGTSNSGNLRFFNTQTGVMRMLINELGNLAIGPEAPEARLHVSGSGNLAKFSGTEGEWHGISIKTADASASTGKLAYIDLQNENSIPVSSMHSYAYGDGGSDLFFHTTPPGNRTQDRRVERIRIDKYGNTQINSFVGIGRGVDGNYQLAVSGRTYSNGFRAEQGGPNNVDASLNGYSFGADGDTGMFSIGNGAASGTIAFFTNNAQAMTINGTNINTTRNLTVTGNIYTNKEININNTPTGNQLRLIQGNYGLIVRNDGGNFYMLPTNSGDQNGDWNGLRPFSFDLAGGNVTMAHNVYIGYSWGATPYKLNVNGEIGVNGWVRTHGNVGWYSETWGGGWHMTDSNWIRSYGNKPVYVENVIGTNSGVTIGYNGQSPTPGGLSVREHVGIGLGTQSSITLPGARLHVKGAANRQEIARFEGSSDTTVLQSGISVKLANAAATRSKIGFVAFCNELTNELASVNAQLHTDGGSDLYFMTSEPGDRVTDRRAERLRIDKHGDAKFSDTVTAIGFKAGRGIPGTLGNNGLVGYSFINDGDTGMFCPTGSLRLCVDNVNVIEINPSQAYINQPLRASSTSIFDGEVKIGPTSTANQLRLAQGSYGVIARNDGANFYLLPTNANDVDGSWNNLRPFYFNVSTGNVNMNHNVSVGGTLSVGGTVTAAAYVGNGSGLTGNAKGNRTVSTSGPSGGSDGDIWYQY